MTKIVTAMFGIQTWIFMVTDYVLYVFLARETFAGLPEYATVIGILIGTQLGQNYLYGKYDGYENPRNQSDYGDMDQYEPDIRDL